MWKMVRTALVAAHGRIRKSRSFLYAIRRKKTEKRTFHRLVENRASFSLSCENDVVIWMCWSHFGNAPLWIEHNLTENILNFFIENLRFFFSSSAAAFISYCVWLWKSTFSISIKQPLFDLHIHKWTYVSVRFLNCMCVVVSLTMTHCFHQMRVTIWN